MSSTSILEALVLAANDVGYGVGSGRIKGGWGYVWASYGITWGAIALYTLSLWLRRKLQPDSKEPS